MVLLSKPIFIKGSGVPQRSSSNRGRRNWPRTRSFAGTNNSSPPSVPVVIPDSSAGPSVPLPCNAPSPQQFPVPQYLYRHQLPFASPPQNQCGYMDVGFQECKHPQCPPPTVNYQSGSQNCHPTNGPFPQVGYYTPPGSAPQFPTLSYGSSPPGFGQEPFAGNASPVFANFESPSSTPPQPTYLRGVDYSMIHSSPQPSPPIPVEASCNWYHHQPLIPAEPTMMNAAPYCRTDQAPNQWECPARQLESSPPTGPYQGSSQFLESVYFESWMQELSGPANPDLEEPKRDEASTSVNATTTSFKKNRPKKQEGEKPGFQSSKKPRGKISPKPRSSPPQSKMYCRFCKNNRETKEFYESHFLKEADGKTTSCPILRKYVCPLCGGTGDNGHSLGYCPKNPDNKLTGKRKCNAMSLLRNSMGKIGAYLYK